MTVIPFHRGNPDRPAHVQAQERIDAALQHLDKALDEIQRAHVCVNSDPAATDLDRIVMRHAVDMTGGIRRSLTRYQNTPRPPSGAA